MIGRFISMERSKRRVWSKLHLAVDADTYQLVSAVVLIEWVSDSAALPILLNPLRRMIEQLSGNGTYDRWDLRSMGLTIDG
jgi:hypothetical protein